MCAQTWHRNSSPTWTILVRAKERAVYQSQVQPSASFLCCSQHDKAEELVGGSHALDDSGNYTSEPRQVVHPGVAYTPDNTTWETELGLARAPPHMDSERVGRSLLQEVIRVCEASHGADAPVNVTPYANCPSTPCLYPGVEGTLCLQEISCVTVPNHFIGHGIENKSRKDMIECEWEGCAKRVARHTFVRHVREVHLRHMRGTSVHNSENDPSRQLNTLSRETW
ncbi:hypothetical protein EDC04DRAFT_2603797 [Pisolithus marmoratus]|nr:hypothetical protein EDC04DRAFT_2603797 [Pisolithus marmoratus]